LMTAQFAHLRVVAADPQTHTNVTGLRRAIAQRMPLCPSQPTADRTNLRDGWAGSTGQRT
jgi:hypothetical protein